MQAGHDLECEALTKRFAGVAAVRDVSFAIPRGSFFSILGPSGCGKTTLMRMIAGFEQPTAGDIRIRGASVLHVPPNRRNAKMVFQNLALFPMMNVAYGLRCRRVSRREIEARVAAVLDRVGLAGFAERPVSQLSGGQRQRVAIARCMVLEPDVLLLDEPLGALDLKLRERMKVELKLMQQRFATTFVYITHDQSEALTMSDRVAVMNEGRFEQVGTPRELYHAPATAFVGESNRWTGRVVAVGRDGVEVETAAGVRLHGRPAEARGSVAEGARVSVFVRPAAIALAPPASERLSRLANRVPGIVESVLFDGAASRVIARMPSGALIESALPAAGEAEVRAGEAVELGWPSAETRLFADAA
ncbi:ABC transporter ATP-binding protein [Aureimonas leprariae]|uniref:ABC transporter ATP-binding protein n=1 Tax=Plantimonas leprariae TaxID=2615207 RepID=A0A7V7TV57_9HYPH|nr:ABC transporter ATP-binding protein [Aureimonas leprariae]KAB0677335.1 ABC transporter ATP-binding protein [Aureimonas leprariae]